MEIRGFGIGLSQELKKRAVNPSAFERELSSLIDRVNKEQMKSEAMKEAVLRGEDIPMHELVLQSQKAKVALDLLIQIRNKLLEAYQELHRMQV